MQAKTDDAIHINYILHITLTWYEVCDDLMIPSV